MSTRTSSARIGQATSGLGVLALAAAIAGTPVAVAGTISSAITSVNVAEESAAAGAAVTVKATWAVPDGSRAGDTFTLTLPQMLVADSLNGISRDLAAPDGQIVARYTVRGQVVTFTLTEFAETHIGVHGTATFGVRLNRSLQPGENTPVVFEVNGVTWPSIDQIDITGPGPGADYSSTATKWQNWVRVGDDPRGGILWAITGPAVPAALVSQGTYEIADTPGAGQRIDCDSLTVWTGATNLNGSIPAPSFVPASRYEKQCSGETASVSIRPEDADAGKVFMLQGRSVITDSARSEYRNSGVVTLWGKAAIPVSSVLTVTAGGDGEGRVTPTTSPAEPTTTSPAEPTTTSPAVPTATNPGVPAEPSGISTATPIAPGTTATTGSASPPASAGSGTRTSDATATSQGSTSTRTSAGSPNRIDTGVPGDEPDVPLLVLGGLMTAGSLTVLGVALRRGLRRRAGTR